MKWTSCCRLILGVALALLHPPGLSSQELGSENRVPGRSFTSQDGTFRFEYPASLVSCKHDPTQPDRWVPGDSCEAYIPICSDVSGKSDNTAACVADPATGMKNETNFQAAAFSVNRRKDANTVRECLSVAEPPPHVGTSHTETINGTKFIVTETVGVAAGNLLEGYVYRTFHGKVCYELDIRIAFSNLGQHDPGAGPDLEKVRHNLKNVLNSFTFLK